jgi:hypothetical protein
MMVFYIEVYKKGKKRYGKGRKRKRQKERVK